MSAPTNPLTELEAVVERIVDFLQKELNDPIFMADFQNFLTVLGDFLEAQTGDTSTPAPPKPVSSAQSAPQAQAPGVVYHAPGESQASAQAAVRDRRQNPTVTRYSKDG